MNEDLPIVENAAQNRLEAALGNELAVLEYLVEGDRMLFTHTEVPPAFRGRGVAEKLVLEGFRIARERGMKIVPICSYVEAVLRRHPKFAKDA